MGLGLLLIVIHQCLDVRADVTEVEVHILEDYVPQLHFHHTQKWTNLCVELILGGVQHQILQPISRSILHLHAVVADSHQLVHHRLVSPLIEKGRHRVLTPLDDHQHCVGLAPLEENILPRHRLLQLIGQSVGIPGVALEADYRPLLHRQQHTDQTLHTSAEHSGGEVEGRLIAAGHTQGTEVGSQWDHVGVELSHLAHSLLLVRLRQRLDVGLGYDVGEV